jgi:hypothetical protein
VIDPKRTEKGENSTASGQARFGGLDQLDCLMIVLSVLLGTVAKQHHFLDLPGGFLEWVLPFLLMAAGYKARGYLADRIESRRVKAKGNSGE